MGLLQYHSKAAKKTETATKAAPVKEKAEEKKDAETDGDKLTARQARFGTTSEETKMAERAKRFGTKGLQNSDFLSKNRLAARAQRFGLPSKADPSLLVTDEKKRKRMERFGIVEPEERLSKRQKRFGSGKNELPGLPTASPEELERMKKRKERFAKST